MGPLADFVVSMHDGKVLKQGSLTDVLEEDVDLVQQLKHDEDELQKEQETDLDERTEQTEAEKKSAGKLIMVEEIPLGHVSRDASQRSCVFIQSYSHALYSILVFQGVRREASHYHWTDVSILFDPGERYHRGSVVVPRILGFPVH
jgi:ABC-type glutathione transport system ATPase component